MFVCPMDVSLIDSRLGDEQLLVFDFIFSEGVGAVRFLWKWKAMSG